MIRIFFLVLLLLPALPAAAANCWLPMDPLPPDYCRDRTTFVETAPNDTDPLDGAIRRVLQSCKEQNPATATLRKAAFAATGERYSDAVLQERLEEAFGFRCRRPSRCRFSYRNTPEELQTHVSTGQGGAAEDYPCRAGGSSGFFHSSYETARASGTALINAFNDGALFKSQTAVSAPDLDGDYLFIDDEQLGHAFMRIDQVSDPARSRDQYILSLATGDELEALRTANDGMNHKPKMGEVVVALEVTNHLSYLELNFQYVLRNSLFGLGPVALDYASRSLNSKAREFARSLESRFGGHGGDRETYLSCPEGIIGLQTGSGKYVDRLRVLCSGETGDSAIPGGGGGSGAILACPEGSMVRGLHGGAGKYLDRVGVLCQDVEYPFPAVGGGGGSPFTFACESGALAGIWVRHGKYVDSIVPVCR